MFDISQYRYGDFGEAMRQRVLIERAEEHLKELGARDFNLREFQDECLCLEKNSGLWVIYYAERGGKSFIAAFASLSSALDHFAFETLGRPLGLDWNAIYAEPLESA